MVRRNWTREELIVAFNLYCRVPFGRIHNRNPEIIETSAALERTPSALSWKLANFARLDPALKQRSIAGATHGGQLERDVWNEFSRNWEALSFESERLRRSLIGRKDVLDEALELPEGMSRQALVKIRVNQNFFRAAVLAAYDNKCCITGLAVSELLSASHIVPWSEDAKNRTNPKNGLCLNALHDRAFDRGLLTVEIDYTIRLSPILLNRDNSALTPLLLESHNQKISVPRRFPPDPLFLQHHADHIFKR